MRTYNIDVRHTTYNYFRLLSTFIHSRESVDDRRHRGVKLLHLDILGNIGNDVKIASRWDISVRYFHFRFVSGRLAFPVSVDVGRCQRRSCRKMYKSTLEFHVFVPRGKGSFYPRRTNEPLQCRNKSASIGGLNTQFKEQPHVVLHVMFTGLNKSDNDAITQRYSVSSRSSLTAAITCRKTRMTWYDGIHRTTLLCCCYNGGKTGRRRRRRAARPSLPLTDGPTDRRETIKLDALAARSPAADAVAADVEDRLSKNLAPD